MKPNTKLRAVDPNTEHNRDLAKRLIRNRNRRKSFKGLCTAHDFELDLKVVGEYGGYDKFKVESADVNRERGTITLWSN